MQLGVCIILVILKESKYLLCILSFNKEVGHSILGIILQTIKEPFNCNEKYENYDGG